MSIRQSPQPTERAQAARSANAQQATGPATPEGKARSKMNALKYGDHARDFRQAIKLQGDDVQAFDGLYHALLDHYQPEPPETAFQVADLAKLRWQLQREERRQCRILSTRLAWVETCYHDRAAEVNDPDCPRPHCPDEGLAYAEDIPGRYRMAIETLDKFADRVRRRDFQPFRLYEESCSVYLEQLYGTTGYRRERTGRARRVIELTHRCLGDQECREREWPPPDEQTVPELLRLIAEERRQWERDFEAFKTEYVVRDPEAAYVAAHPEEDEPDDQGRVAWEESQRREERLRRAIDRKVRLLMALERGARLALQNEARLALDREARLAFDREAGLAAQREPGSVSGRETGLAGRPLEGQAAERSGPQDEGWGPRVRSEVEAQTEPDVLVRQETAAGQAGVAATEAAPDSAEAGVSAPERASAQGDGNVAATPRGSTRRAAKPSRRATKAGVTARGSEVSPGAGEGAERDTNNQNSQNEPGMSAGIKDIKKRGRAGGGQGGA